MGFERRQNKILTDMKKNRRIFYVSTAVLLTCAGLLTPDSNACTSAIVSGRASADGRPFIWKHRDTGTEHNFLEKVEKPGCITYIALFNGGDSLLQDAWMGMNEEGFMIMNTASYNLAPDTTKFVDQEGVVMRKALEKCRTVDDFLVLLDTLPKPLGVQANFGVIDANGNGGYFETDDYSYTPYFLSDSVPYIVRTNYSFSGNDTDGYGYIRYDNACRLMGEPPYSPELFTETLSRSFYHSLLDQDVSEQENIHWVIDQDFIPRNISTASIVMVNGMGNQDDVMFAALGYPPVAELYKVTFNDIPEDVRPVAPGFRSPANNNSLERKRKAFPIHRGSGSHYIDMQYLKPVNDSLRQRNLELYK